MSYTRATRRTPLLSMLSLGPREVNSCESFNGYGRARSRRLTEYLQVSQLRLRHGSLVLISLFFYAALSDELGTFGYHQVIILCTMDIPWFLVVARICFEDDSPSAMVCWKLR